MSFLSLSESSKFKIFEILGDRMSTIALLRRTNALVNLFAEANNLNKVNADHISLISLINHDNEGEYIISGTLTRKKPADEVELLENKKKTAKKGKGSTANRADGTLRLEENIKGEYPRMAKGALQMLQKLLDKVKSIEKLSLENFQINIALLKKLLTWKKHFSSVRILTLQTCTVSLTAKELTDFLDLFNLHTLKMDGTTFENPVLGDIHLANLSSLSLGEYERDNNMRCPGITDESVNRWRSIVPTTLKLADAHTSITFEAIWHFLHDYVDNYESMTKDVEVCLGQIDRNDENIWKMTFAMKIPGFKWEEKSWREVQLSYEITYKPTNRRRNGHSLKFEFSI